ncbi:MAG: hypothetical protein ACPLY9_01435, partial [Nitrososphaerales archaeon]
LHDGSAKRPLAIFAMSSKVERIKYNDSYIVRMLTLLDEVMVGFHAILGLLALIGGTWFFAEMRKRQVDIRTVKFLSLAIASLVWITWLTGGWWYVNYYPVDRAVINAGAMPYAHSLVMETKEHIFYIGLLIATTLPIYVYGLSNKLVAGDAGAKRLLMALAVIVVLGGIVLESAGGLISIAAKYSWMVMAGG